MMPAWLTIELAVLTIVLPAFGFLIHWRVDSARRFAVIETNAENLKTRIEQRVSEERMRNDNVCSRLTAISNRIATQGKQHSDILTDIRERLAGLEATANGKRDG